jgi:ABC-2 type transport system permease protein
MGNLMKTEWYKLKKDRSLWLLSALLIMLAVLFPLDTMRSFDGISDPSKKNDYYIGNILSINTDIVKLLPAILAGFFIASEFSLGTMKSIVSSGNSRIRIYLAKLAVFSVGSVIILLILPILMMGFSVIYMGFEVMPEWTFYAQTVGLIALYAAAFASVMAFFAVAFADSGKTIGFLLLFLALVNSVLELVSSKIPFLAPAIDNSIFMSQQSILAIGQIGHWDSDAWFTFIWVPVLTFLAFAILGGLLFSKKEIK